MRIREIIHEEMNRIIQPPSQIKTSRKKKAVHAPSSTNGREEKKKKAHHFSPSYS